MDTSFINRRLPSNFVIDESQVRDVGWPQIRSNAVGVVALQQVNGRMGAVSRCAVWLLLKVNRVRTCDILDGRKYCLESRTSRLHVILTAHFHLRINQDETTVLYCDASAPHDYTCQHGRDCA